MSLGLLCSVFRASPSTENSQDQWTTPLQQESTPTALAGGDASGGAVRQGHIPSSLARMGL